MALIKCPECGKEISDKSEFCISCGFPLSELHQKSSDNDKPIKDDSKSVVNNDSLSLVQTKVKERSPVNKVEQEPKNKRNTLFFLLLGLIVVAIIGIFIIFPMFWKGKFSLEQAEDTIELGKSTDLKQLVNYDENQIIDIEIVNDGGFDYNKLGNYTVTFSAINSRKKMKDFTFIFHVTDTIAPEISISKDEIYIPKGNELILDDLISVKDNCNDVKIDHSGDINTSEEGTYPIEIFAVDSSGNVSDKKKITVVIEDRSGTDIRNVKFGDSIETVKRYEDLEIIDETENLIFYGGCVLDGNNANLLYAFNENDELYLVSFNFTDTHTDYSLYITDFNNVSNKITKKYGEPSEVEKGKGSLYSYCNDEGEALQTGQVAYRNIWNCGDIDIFLVLRNDNYSINYSLIYMSKIYPEPQNLDEY